MKGFSSKREPPAVGGVDGCPQFWLAWLAWLAWPAASGSFGARGSSSSPKSSAVPNAGGRSHPAPPERGGD